MCFPDGVLSLLVCPCELCVIALPFFIDRQLINELMCGFLFYHLGYQYIRRYKADSGTSGR